MIGGAQLAGGALRAGLLDECQLLVHPILLGGGKPFLPGGTRAGLELLEERRLGKATAHLRYRVAT